MASIYTVTIPQQYLSFSPIRQLVEGLDGCLPLTFLLDPFATDQESAPWPNAITFEVMAEPEEDVPWFENQDLDRRFGGLLRALVVRQKVSLTHVATCKNTYKVVATDVSVLLAKVPTLALREELARRR